MAEKYPQFKTALEKIKFGKLFIRNVTKNTEFLGDWEITFGMKFNIGSPLVHNRFGLYLLCLRIAGIPVFMKEKSKLYILYEIFVNVCYHGMALACCIHVIEVKDDLKEMLATLRIAMSVAMVSVLHIFIRIRVKEFEELLQLTDMFTWEEVPARNPETGKLTSVGWMDMIRKIVKHALISTLIFHSTQSLYRLLSAQDSLVFHAWYPYNYTTSPGKELTNISQALASVFGMATIFAFPGLYATVVAIGCCQFHKLKMMMQVIFQKENSVDTENQLKKCIVLHQNILEYMSKMEEVLNNILGALLFTLMTNICVVAFSVIISWGDYVDMAQSIFIYVNWMTQVFIICWSANELSGAAEDAKRTACETDWIGAPVYIQRSILLMMTRANQPFVLTAGKFVPVNNETMMNIFNESLSLFMFLLEMKDKHDVEINA